MEEQIWGLKAPRRWIKGAVKEAFKRNREAMVDRASYEAVAKRECAGIATVADMTGASFNVAMRSLDRLEAAGMIAANQGNQGGYVIESAYERPRVFIDSMSDFFETDTGQRIIDHNGDQVFWAEPGTEADKRGRFERFVSGADCSGGESIPVTLNDLRSNAFGVIDATPHLDWLIVTKRPENIAFQWEIHPSGRHQENMTFEESHRRDNVWLLASTENQEEADKRIPYLLKARGIAAVLGLSVEPMLGQIDVRKYLGPEVHHHPDNQIGDLDLFTALNKVSRAVAERKMGGAFLDWVICGGESGPKSRPMAYKWAEHLRDQCVDASVPFFFKQWGAYAPLKDLKFPKSQHSLVVDGCEMVKLGKKNSGRILCGRDWSQLPGSLVVG